MSAHALTTQIEDLAAALAAVPGFPETEATLADLRALGERATARPRDLTYVLLFGPTGCGKSRICNSLFGRIVTPVGYRRPTTETPAVIVPRALGRTVIDSLPVLPFELVELEGDGFARIVLVDTPDIDSLRAEHRALADAFVRFADAVVVVLDTAKYADESIWHYLRRFERERTTCAIVLNKVSDDAAPADLRAKLDDEGMATPVLTLPHQPSHDHELLGESDGLRALRATLSAWAGSEAVRREALVRAASRAINQLTAHVVPHLAERARAIEDLLAEIDRIAADKVEAFRRGLPFSLDRETLATMYAQVLAKLERIDPLRFPRRILSYPIRLLREKLGWAGRERAPAEEWQEVRDLREEAFVGAGLELADAIEAACAARSVAAPDTAPEAALRDAFRAFQADFETRIKQSADEIARKLTVGQRVRFYTTQALVFGALIGVEVHTGGILTVTEVVTGGVLSPFAAKLVGMALSAEESHRFQEKARRTYLDDAAQVLLGQVGPARERIRERAAAIDGARGRADELLRVIEALGRRDA